jgi:hypothetical protein
VKKTLVLSILLGLIVLAVLVMAVRVRARTQADLIGCQVYLKRIGEDLTRYAKDHGGSYPERLEQLEPDYIAKVPRCFTSEKPYRYTPSAAGFQVSCDGSHRGLRPGYPMVDQSNFLPQPVPAAK